MMTTLSPSLVSISAGYVSIWSTNADAATKCDDISCSEVIRALGLENEDVLEELEEKIEANSEETKSMKKQKAVADKLVKSTSLVLESLLRLS